MRRPSSRSPTNRSARRRSPRRGRSPTACRAGWSASPGHRTSSSCSTARPARSATWSSWPRRSARPSCSAIRPVSCASSATSGCSVPSGSDGITSRRSPRGSIRCRSARTPGIGTCWRRCWSSPSTTSAPGARARSSCTGRTTATDRCRSSCVSRRHRRSGSRDRPTSPRCATYSARWTAPPSSTAPARCASSASA